MTTTREQRDVTRFDAACENTDRHLWPLVSEHADADTIHVTKGGGIGINVGGQVIVLPLREWHALALRSASQAGGVPAGPESVYADRILRAPNKRRSNRPLPDEPGMRIVGWVVTEEVAGMSDALFALEEIERRALLSASPPPPATDGDALRGMTTANNTALLKLSKVWQLDGDWMKCRACKAVMIASRDGEAMHHKTGCKHAAHVHPWAELRNALASVPTPVSGTDAVEVERS